MIDFQDSQLNNCCIVTYYFLCKSILQMHSVYKISKLDMWTPGHASQLRSYLTRYLQIFHHFLTHAINITIFLYSFDFSDFFIWNPFIDFFIHLSIPFFKSFFSHLSEKHVKISTRFNYEKNYKSIHVENLDKTFSSLVYRVSSFSSVNLSFLTCSSGASDL